MAIGLLGYDAASFPLARWRAQHSVRRFALDLRTSFGIGAFARELARAMGVERASVHRYCGEARAWSQELTRRWWAEKRYRATPFQLASAEALYVTTRAARPLCAVETGVWRGISSSYLLAALAREDRGELHSIDLPTYEPTGRTNRDGQTDRASVTAPSSVGDLVPDELRPRWHLSLGDAAELLPRLLGELGTIDLFFHDSDHSYPHMTFEFEIAWRHLRPGGWLTSDDVTWSEGARAAWADFCRGVDRPPYRYFSRDGNRGLLRKPNAPA